MTGHAEERPAAVAPPRPRIAVMRRIPEPALDVLLGAGDLWVSPHDRPLSPEELRGAARGASALVTLLHDRVDEALLDAAGPGLRVVANVAVGHDNVDVAACTARGVLVTNTPGVLTEATADLAMALILMTTRRLAEGERLIRARRPWTWHMFFLLGAGLQGKRLGVIGLGKIGQATARRARAFGMEIAYAGRREADPAVVAELGAIRLDLDALLRTSDVVSLHCPLTPETRHLVGAAELRRMKPTAHLVNTSRGPVVDEAALAEALRAGVIRGAALDVFEEEPEVHPGLLDLDSAVLLPHLGSATIEARTAMAVLAARNVLARLAGARPPTPVNPEVLGE
ncbi:MAG: D-glycerate dehydrogenase [Polyangiaceae bacterium]|nr:D-glycerate dehydrogenase [Polyangiaceae bacterium]